MTKALNIPTLETPRMVMRGWQSSDIEPMIAFFANDESKFYGGPFNEAEAWRRVASYAGQWQINGIGEWVLEHKDSGEFLGFCGPWFPAEYPEAEIAWALLPQHYGHGYAYEAAVRAIQYVYQDLGWTTVMSLIEAANTASIKLATRLGAEFEKPFRENGWDAQIWRHLPPTKFLERFA